MNSEKLFGAPARGAAAHNDHDGLKLVLHRYIIDAIEESGQNLLEGSRQSLAQFVIDKVAEYITRMHLAISRYEMERLAEEIVDELTGFGPLEVLLRDVSITEILVNGPHRVFIERDGVLHQSDLRFIDAHHVERVMQRILAPSEGAWMSRRRWSMRACPMAAGSMRSSRRLPWTARACRSVSFAGHAQEQRPGGDANHRPQHLRVLPGGGGQALQYPHQWRHRHRQDHAAQYPQPIDQPHERLVTIEDVAELQLGHPMWCAWKPARPMPKGMARSRPAT